MNEADPDIAELPPEVLQNIYLLGMPLSKLQLKVGAPVMLLRNLCPQEGLCNGSRMSVHSLGRFSIQVQLLGGDFDGQLRTIPRIKLQSTDQQLSFTLSRKQFPLTLSFTMTINKSQGQSFKAVGVDLRSPVFSHGQFYVAASRVTLKAGLYILLPPNTTKTSNIVYSEILQGLA